MVLNTVWEEYRDIECYPARSGKTLSITSKKNRMHNFQTSKEKYEKTKNKNQGSN